MNKPKVIILHHSATKDGVVKDYKAIKNYHENELGWNDIGYHWIIEMVGGEPMTIKGRDESTNGAHTKGMNAKSIGVCVVGNYDKENLPTVLYSELLDLILDIRLRRGNLPLKQHNEYANKTCPGLNFPFEQLEEDANKKKAPPWKEDAIQWALDNNVIDSYHDPLEPLDIGTYLEIERKKALKNEKV